MGYTGNKWTHRPVADRRKIVANLHAKGLPNNMIARRLGVADTTVSQDLLALGLRKPRAAELTPHGLGKLDLVALQALFLDGMSNRERATMTGKTASFTLAELSRDQLIAAILRQHEETPAPAYPRVPGAGSAPARPPAGAPAGAGSDGDTGVAARPEHARRAS